MRISDWSSDVCSSDLAPGERQVRAPLPRDRAAGAGGRRAPAGPAAGRAGGVLGACQAWGSRMKTLLLFLVTALAEIIGCYLPYLWLRKDGSAWLLLPARSEERSVGKEWVRPCRSRGAPCQYKNKN